MKDPNKVMESVRVSETTRAMADGTWLNPVTELKKRREKLVARKREIESAIRCMKKGSPGRNALIAESEELDMQFRSIATSLIRRGEDKGEEEENFKRILVRLDQIMNLLRCLEARIDKFVGAKNDNIIE